MGNTNETKPCIEWLMQYPEPYRSKAIVNIANETCFSDLLNEVLPENIALKQFSWKESPEGESYWNGFYERICQAPAQKHRYPWHEAPEWATCAATDENGEAFWYGVQTFAYVHEGNLSKIFGKFDAADWRESLEIRPVEFQKQKAQ